MVAPKKVVDIHPVTYHGTERPMGPHKIIVGMVQNKGQRKGNMGTVVSCACGMGSLASPVKVSPHSPQAGGGKCATAEWRRHLYFVQLEEADALFNKLSFYPREVLSALERGAKVFTRNDAPDISHVRELVLPPHKQTVKAVEAAKTAKARRTKRPIGSQYPIVDLDTVAVKATQGDYHPPTLVERQIVEQQAMTLPLPPPAPVLNGQTPPRTVEQLLNVMLDADPGEVLRAITAWLPIYVNRSVTS